MGYSAKIEIYLDVDGVRLRVHQVGPRDMILFKPHVAEPGSPAVLTVVVDGEVDEQSVVLPHGIDGSSLKVAYF